MESLGCRYDLRPIDTLEFGFVSPWLLPGTIFLKEVLVIPDGIPCQPTKVLLSLRNRILKPLDFLIRAKAIILGYAFDTNFG